MRESGTLRPMIVWLRKVLIRLLLPVSWFVRRRRPIETLCQFAETESDSGWQFLRAFDQCPDPVQRAHLFHNLLEEREHASLFTELVERRGGRVRLSAENGRTSLLEQEGTLPAFLAYVHAGELDIAHEFGAYARAVPDDDVRKVFEHIKEEEDGHHSNLQGALLAIYPDPVKAAALVSRARRRRTWRAFQRGSKRIGDAFLAVWLVALYIVLGPFCVFQGRRRLARSARS